MSNIKLPVTYTGTTGADDLSGKSKGDVLFGLDGNDTLTGGRGADTLDGGAGDDRLYGGAGADVLTGGQGADYFFIDGPVGKTLSDLDQVTDFTQGDGDRLVFSDKIAITGHTLVSATLSGYSEALAFAQHEIGSGAASIVTVQLSEGVVVFAGANLDHSVDAAVLLTGKSLTDVTTWGVI